MRNKEKAHSIPKSLFKSDKEVLSEINDPSEPEDLTDGQEGLSSSQVPPESYVSFTNYFTNPSETLHLTEKNLIDSIIEGPEQTSEVCDFAPEDLGERLEPPKCLKKKKILFSFEFLPFRVPIFCYYQ